MKLTLVVMGATVVLGGLLSSCGGTDGSSGMTTSATSSGGGSGAATPPPSPVASTAALPSPQDTAGVLAAARSTSETEEPFAPNDGAFAFTDTSEKTEATAVNGT